MEKVIAEINGLMQAFQSNKPIVSSKAYGWKSAALRMRKDSLKLEKLFKEFRKLSVAEANKPA